MRPIFKSAEYAYCLADHPQDCPYCLRYGGIHICRSPRLAQLPGSAGGQLPPS